MDLVKFHGACADALAKSKEDVRQTEAQIAELQAFIDKLQGGLDTLTQILTISTGGAPTPTSVHAPTPTPVHAQVHAQVHAPIPTPIPVHAPVQAQQLHAIPEEPAGTGVDHDDDEDDDDRERSYMRSVPGVSTGPRDGALPPLPSNAVPKSLLQAGIASVLSAAGTHVTHNPMAAIQLQEHELRLKEEMRAKEDLKATYARTRATTSA